MLSLNLPSCLSAFCVNRENPAPSLSLSIQALTHVQFHTCYSWTQNWALEWERGVPEEISVKHSGEGCPLPSFCLTTLVCVHHAPHLPQ